MINIKNDIFLFISIMFFTVSAFLFFRTFLKPEPITVSIENSIEENANIPSNETIRRLLTEELVAGYDFAPRVKEESQENIKYIKQKLAEFETIGIQECLLKNNNVPLSGLLLSLKISQLTSFNPKQVPWLGLKEKEISEIELNKLKYSFNDEIKAVYKYIEMLNSREKELADLNIFSEKRELIQLQQDPRDKTLVPYHIWIPKSITDQVITKISSENGGYFLYRYGLDGTRDQILLALNQELIVLELKLQEEWRKI